MRVRKSAECLVAVGAFVCAAIGSALAAGETAPPAAAVAETKQPGFSGTFADAAGRKGPMQCLVTPGSGDVWTLKFNAKNEGQGPNRPFDCSFDLTGKKEGDLVNLSGAADVGRPGKFELTVALTSGKMDGKFKKADGSGSGTFNLTAVGKAP